MVNLSSQIMSQRQAKVISRVRQVINDLRAMRKAKSYVLFERAKSCIYIDGVTNHDLEFQKSWYIDYEIQSVGIVAGHNKSHHIILQIHSVSRCQRVCFGARGCLNGLVRDFVNCTKHDFLAYIDPCRNSQSLPNGLAYYTLV